MYHEHTIERDRKTLLWQKDVAQIAEKAFQGISELFLRIRARSPQ